MASVVLFSRGMSFPRPVLPGKRYLITRRVTQRLFLLKPSRQVNEAFLYCLAVAAEKFGVEVHAYCVLRATWKNGTETIVTSWSVLGSTGFCVLTT